MSYLEHFEQIVKDQLARVERLKESSELTDYKALDKIIELGADVEKIAK